VNKLHLQIEGNKRSVVPPEQSLSLMAVYRVCVQGCPAVEREAVRLAVRLAGGEGRLGLGWQQSRAGR